MYQLHTVDRCLIPGQHIILPVNQRSPKGTESRAADQHLAAIVFCKPDEVLLIFRNIPRLTPMLTDTPSLVDCRNKTYHAIFSLFLIWLRKKNDPKITKIFSGPASKL